jgi:hypothetical protein
MSKASYSGRAFVVLLHRLADAQASRRLHREIATELGMSRNYFANLVTGQTAVPISDVPRVMSALGVSDNAIGIMMVMASLCYRESKHWKSFTSGMNSMPKDVMPGWHLYFEVLPLIVARIEAGDEAVMKIILDVLVPPREPILKVAA